MDQCTGSKKHENLNQCKDCWYECTYDYAQL